MAASKEPKAKVDGSDSWAAVEKGAFQLVRIKLGTHKGKIAYYGADIPIARLVKKEFGEKLDSYLALVQLCFDTDGRSLQRMSHSYLEAYGPILPVHRLLASLLDVWDGDEANALGDWCLERGLEVLGEQLVACATAVVDDPKLRAYGKCGPTRLAYDCLCRLGRAMCVLEGEDWEDFQGWCQRWEAKVIYRDKVIYQDTDSVFLKGSIEVPAGRVFLEGSSAPMIPAPGVTTVQLPSNPVMGQIFTIEVPAGRLVTAGSILLSSGLHRLIFTGENWFRESNENLTAAVIAARNGFSLLGRADDIPRARLTLQVGNNVVAMDNVDLLMPLGTQMGAVVHVDIRAHGVQFVEPMAWDQFVPEIPNCPNGTDVSLRRMVVGDQFAWLVTSRTRRVG